MTSRKRRTTAITIVIPVQTLKEVAAEWRANNLQRPDMK